MSRKHHDRAFGHCLCFIDEDRAALLQTSHNMSVMHDLLAHVDGRAEALQSFLDGLHSSVDPGTIATGLGQQHAAGLGRHATHTKCSSPTRVRGAWWVRHSRWPTANYPDWHSAMSACGGTAASENDVTEATSAIL